MLPKTYRFIGSSTVMAMRASSYNLRSPSFSHIASFTAILNSSVLSWARQNIDKNRKTTRKETKVIRHEKGINMVGRQEAQLIAEAANTIIPKLCHIIKFCNRKQNKQKGISMHIASGISAYLHFLSPRVD